MAVYLDDWSSGTRIFGNIFYRSGRSAFIGGGRDNIIENNLFIECEPSVHVDARGLGWASYYFDRNNEHFVSTLFDRLEAMRVDLPPFSDRYPTLKDIINDDPALPKGNRISNNISTGGRWLDLHNGLDFDLIDIKNNVIADSVLIRWSGRSNIPTTYHSRQDTGIVELLKDNDNVVLFDQMETIELPGRKIYLDTASSMYDNGFQPLPVSHIGLQLDHFRQSLN